jgi:hypothetical protein
LSGIQSVPSGECSELEQGGTSESDEDEEVEDTLDNEASILMAVSHKNIIPLLTTVTYLSDGQTYGVVLPCYRDGSLQQYVTR